MLIQHRVMLIAMIMGCGNAFAQPDTTLPESIKTTLLKQANDTGKVRLLNKLAGIYRRTDQDSLIRYAQQAHKLAETFHDNKGMADAGMLIGVYLRDKGDFPAALPELLKAIHLYERYGKPSAAANTYLEVAQVYKDMSGEKGQQEYLSKGLDYAGQSLQLFKNINDTAGIAYSMNMQGIIYRDKAIMQDPHYYDTAINIYLDAIKLIEISGKGKENLGRLYNNISQVYTEYKKDYHKALDYLFKAAANNERLHNKSSLSHNYGNISENYLAMHNDSESLLYARKMLQMAQSLKRPSRIQDAFNQLYRVFNAAGKIDSALYYYIAADKLDDSITSVAKTKQVMDMETKYETTKKESSIQRLQLIQHDNKKQIILLSCILAIVAVFATSMILLYRRVRHQRQLIAAQSKGLEVMMKELHHRVKNNLQIVSSLLSLQTYKMKDEGTVAVLRESQQRVQAMSLIHQRLYNKDELTAVNMKEYLTDLSESLLSSYGYTRDSFDLEISIDTEMLDIDKALPIGLMMNELITNALKYAYAKVVRPSLQIVFIQNTQQMIFTVKDNGPGIDETAWKQKGNSFGKKLITALCKQLRAQQTLAVDNGTAFTITIPREAA